MGFPTDLSDVVSGGNITASRNNAITNKIGIDNSEEVTSLDYLIKNTDSKLGKIASLAADSNYLVGDGAMVGANWGVKSSSEVVTDLGLVIGTNVQAYNAVLTNLSNPSPSATDKYLTFVGSNYDAVTTAEVRADIFNLGSDATGDVFYRNASGILTRLGVGSADEVLTLAGSPALPTWAAAGGGSSAFTEAVTITATDNTNPLLTITQSGTGGLLSLTGTSSSSITVDAEGHIVMSIKEGMSTVPMIDIDGVRKTGQSPVFLRITEGATEILWSGVQSGQYQTRVASFKCSLGSAFGGRLDLTAAAGQIYFSGTGANNIQVNDTGADLDFTFKSLSSNMGWIFLGGRKVATGEQSFMQFTPTFNKATSGDAIALLVDVTDTSTPDSLFFADYRIGGVSKMTVDENAIVNYNGTMGNSAKNPTTDAPADWVQVEIGGTAYYIPAYAVS